MKSQAKLVSQNTNGFTPAISWTWWDDSDKENVKFAKDDDDDDGDKAWTCLALVTRSLRGKMMKIPRRRAMAMLMITWYMRMMTPLSGTNLR